jgi:hypothetical protein
MQGKYFNEERQTAKARSKWKENKKPQPQRENDGDQNNSDSEWSRITRKEGGLTEHLHHKETRRVLKAALEHASMLQQQQQQHITFM